MLDDVERVRAYGREHPEHFAGVRLAWDPGAYLVAAFTAEPDAHGERLRARLDHPDRLVVEQQPWSQAERESIARELRELIARRSG